MKSLQLYVGLTFVALVAPFAEAAQLYDAVKMELFRKQKSDFDQMVMGERPVSLPVLDQAADFYVLRSTWADMLIGAPLPQYPVNYSKEQYQKEFDEDLIQRMINPRASAQFVNAFAPKLVKRFERITNELNIQDEFDRRSLLFGLQLLQPLGRVKHESVAKFLHETMIDSKKHEVFKLWAIKGLAEQFPLVPIDDGNWKEAKNEARRLTDARRIDDLVSFIFRPKPDGMDEGAYLYFRREAVQALAATRVPAVASVKAVGTADGPVAPTLIRILSKKHDMTPPPTFAEKLEAATALLDLRYNPERYAPELGQYLAGQFFLEMAGKYQDDQPGLKVAPAPGVLRKPPLTTWKVQGARLEKIIDEAKKGAKNPLFPPPLNPATPFSNALLLPLEQMSKSMKNYDALGASFVALRNVVTAWKEPTTTIFKNVTAK